MFPLGELDLFTPIQVFYKLEGFQQNRAAYKNSLVQGACRVRALCTGVHFLRCVHAAAFFFLFCFGSACKLIRCLVSPVLRGGWVEWWRVIIY